nr:SMEK domain-containing protein [Cytophagales bacterium]
MIQRQDYILKISDTLALLETSFRNRIILNLYDSNIFSEDFFEGFLNIVYDLELKNINNKKRNAVSVDLIDEKKRIAFQITSTNTKQKIQETIDSFIKYKLNLEFDSLKILLLKPKKSKYSEFINGSHIKFNNSNIVDFKDLITEIKQFDSTKLQKICNYLSSEVKYYNELNSLNSQTDSKALQNYRSLIKRKALLDSFYLEGSMVDFEKALIEINQAFSTGLIKQGIEVKPIHLFVEKRVKDELENIQYKFMQLHRLYKMYVKTGEIDPDNNMFFPKNEKETISLFDNFRSDIIKDFNKIIIDFNLNEIKI